MISGFISTITWRWTFWVGLIIAGASWPLMLFLPETYGPIILTKRARKLRAQNPSSTNLFVSPLELEPKGFKQMMTVTLTRPIRMLFTELIVMATCLYLALAYGIFYMYFEAYPVIFQGVYHMTTGISGLAFIPIGVGASAAVVIFMAYDNFLERARARDAPWSRREEARRLPLACIGGPCYVISLFWLGWSGRASVHWIVPMLAGIPFGLGFVLIFMALLNYLTDAYEIFAASAMAAASCCRSLFGAVLPFSAGPLYRNLGIAWASSLLGFLSMAMCVIPFAFIRFGPVIRQRSIFCAYLKERKEEEKLARLRNGSEATAHDSEVVAVGEAVEKV